MAATAIRRFNDASADCPHRNRGRTGAEISLGSSIIASGIVRRPVVAANDPLAPIRRMSQAEKIAFFS